MQAILMAFLAVISWAFFAVVLRGTMAVWPVGLGGALSRVVTVVLLGIWIVGTGTGWQRLRPRGTGRWLLAMGGVSIAINTLGFAALKLTTATNMAMLFRLDLVFVVLIGAALGLERIKLWQLMLLPVMLLGLGLLVEVQDFAWTGQVIGDAMVIGSAFGLAVNAFIIRHILRSMDEEAASLYNHGISTFGFVGLAAVYSDLAQAAHLMAQPMAWVWIVALGITAAISLPLYYAALHRMAVWKLRTFMLTAPLFVAVIEWPFFGLDLKPLQWLGAAIILGGLLAMVLLESRLPAAATDEPLAAPTPSAQDAAWRENAAREADDVSPLNRSGPVEPGR